MELVRNLRFSRKYRNCGVLVFIGLVTHTAYGPFSPGSRNGEVILDPQQRTLVAATIYMSYLDRSSSNHPISA